MVIYGMDMVKGKVIFRMLTCSVAR